jgi:hypothetical protein
VRKYIFRGSIWKKIGSEGVKKSMSPNLRKTTYKAESTRFKYSQKNVCIPAVKAGSDNEE